MAKRTNPDFLNGVPELLILRLLAQQPMHGYQLVQAIRRHSGDQLQFGEGCIYPLLHRLEHDGLLTSRREIVGGRTRLVYRPTKAGSCRLAESMVQWRSVVAAIEHVLQGDGGQYGAMAGTTT